MEPRFTFAQQREDALRGGIGRLGKTRPMRRDGEPDGLQGMAQRGMPTAVSPRSYRPDIDGLRALAVVPVVLFHLGLGGLHGGFVGVDVFFVISGYLITGIIVSETGAGTFSVARFYERRVRRIIPNLVAMMLATSLAASILLIPVDLGFYGQSAVAAAMSLSNVYFFLKTGYFDANATQVPLLHTWSLGVEEQYYIAFPLLLFALRKVSRTTLQRVIWALFAISLAISMVQVRLSPSGAFYLPFGRWWELMAGSLLAVGAVPALTGQRAREIVGWTGLIAIIAAILFFNEQMRFPGEAALLPVLGTAALIHANAGSVTRAGRLLSWRPFVKIGLLSYSLYLWHWPPIVLSRYALQRDLSGLETVILLAFILAIAWLAYAFVEKPFRHAAGSRRRLFVRTAAILGLFGAAGLAVWLGKGLPWRYAEQAREFAAGVLDINPRRADCQGRSEARILAGDICRIGTEGVKPSFAFVGDSFADAMTPGIDAAAKRAGTAGLLVIQAGCLPLAGTGTCGTFWTKVHALLGARTELDRIVIAARWPGFIDASRFGLFHAAVPYQRDAETSTSSLEEGMRAIERGFARTAATLGAERMTVLAYMPEQAVHVPQALTLSRQFGLPVPGPLSRAVFEARQSRSRNLIEGARQRLGFGVIDASKAMCGPLDCPIEADGVPLYADDNHPSRSGAIRWSSLFDEVAAAR
jgi:peptidoglycan/LPS O-acetylase OafA/YrhL